MSDGPTASIEHCGATARDRFCVQCGAALDGAARFCPQFGTPLDSSVAVPASTIAPPGSKMPWVFAIGLSIVAAAGVIYAARGRDGLPAGGGPPMATTQVAPAGGGLGPAPDISGLTPREQFARLNDRVMAAAEAGDSATVVTFWPMAFGAYQQLLPGDRDVDARYHMATLYLLLAQFDEVRALADTILIEAPDNLMAWYLRAIVADYEADSTLAREAKATFDDLFPAKIEQPRGEYIDHRDLLDAFRARPGAN